MWQKNSRYFLISLIYQDFFLDSNQVKSNLDLSQEIFIENFNLKKLNTEENSQNIDFAKKQFETYLASKIELTKIYFDLLKDWKNSFAIVKSVLFCFELEFRFLNSSKVDFKSKTLLNKYLKLSNNLANEEVASLIHAILSKRLATLLKT